MVKLLVEHGANPRLGDVLSSACESDQPCQLEKCKYLIDQGAPINRLERGHAFLWSVMPLHRAVIHDKFELVVLLLSCGADRWAENNRGETPLDTARRMRRVDIAMLLET